jgi:ABC-type lipoprotein release transport system permease subunit
VLREGAVLAAAGVAIGLAGAAMAARLLQSQLFGVTPRDGVSYALAAGAIAGAALAACWLPARRASSIQPHEALRAD